MATSTIADCDHKLERHRLALEAGADPTIVAGWMADTRAQRIAAQQSLATATVAPTMTAADVRHLIDELGDLVAVLDEAEPLAKAEVYAALGEQLVLDPQRKRVAVTATPIRVPLSVSEDRRHRIPTGGWHRDTLAGMPAPGRA